MKGFIEVTTIGRDKCIINVSKIIRVRDNVITTTDIDFNRGNGIGGNVKHRCSQSYEEIKELIKKATE